MLIIGFADVMSSMKQKLTEFIVLAKDIIHLMTPMDFLSRLRKLAYAKHIPYIYACKREQLGRACCINSISVVAVKIGPSYFKQKIEDIKHTMKSMIYEEYEENET